MSLHICSLSSLHRQSMEIDKSLSHNLHFLDSLIAAHVCIKNEFIHIQKVPKPQKLAAGSYQIRASLHENLSSEYVIRSNRPTQQTRQTNV